MDTLSMAQPGSDAAAASAGGTAPVKTVPVLLVAGSGRSGSTLLSRILAGVEGAFFGGEIRYLFQRGMIDNRLCGCNVPFSECPVWSAVLTTAFGADGLDPETMIKAGRPLLQARTLPRTLLRRRAAMPADATAYVEHLDRLYAAIRDVTGARFIVDSSKLPLYGAVLDRLDSVDLRIVHLVRDPRAAAVSWRREKAAPDRAEGIMQQQGSLKSAMLWNLWNGTAQRLWKQSPERYLRLRYEDFLAQPRTSVQAILDMMGMSDATLPFLDERTVNLGADHTVAGNPDRLTSGAIALRAQEHWQSKLPARDRLLVTTVTSPLLVRFGYPLRASRTKES